MKKSTLTRAEIVRSVAQATNLPVEDAEILVVEFIQYIKDTLAEGREVKVSGWGRFDLRDKGARPGRNPKTGEDKVITARRVVSFRPGKKLLSRLLQVVGAA